MSSINVTAVTRALRFVARGPLTASGLVLGYKQHEAPSFIYANWSRRHNLIHDGVIRPFKMFIQADAILFPHSVSDERFFLVYVFCFSPCMVISPQTEKEQTDKC